MPQTEITHEWPAEHGFKARTPDPKAYHKLGAGTMLPRSSDAHGGSMGFKLTDKCKVYVDPINPATGEGAETVLDLGAMQEAQVQQAVAGTQNVIERMEMLAMLQKKEAAAPAAPVRREAGREPEARQSEPVGFDWEAEHRRLRDEETYRQRMRAEVQASPPPPAAMPAKPSSISDALVLQMMEEMRSMRGELQQLREVPAQPQYVPPEPEPLPDEPAPERTYAEIGLPFLGVVPSEPELAVVFFWPHGKQQTHYHNAEMRDRLLTLVIDTRYKRGELFIPNETTDDVPIRITVPDRNIDVWVHNKNLHNRNGCMDLLNMIILTAEQVDKHLQSIAEKEAS